MSLALLSKLLLYIILVGFTPGPANIYALSCGLTYGRKAALVMWIGLLVGFSISSTAVALISYYAGAALGDYVQYIKYPGAAYIAWLAWEMLSNKDEGTQNTRECSFVNGLVMQLTNAKMILFAFTTYGTFLLPMHDANLLDFAIVWALLYIAGPVANLVWMLLGIWVRPFITGYHRTRSIVMGIALLVCAVFLLVG